MKSSQVLKRPIITEKSIKKAAANQYTFEVVKKATKRDIKRAVEEYFGVEVYNVTVLNRRGKIRRNPRSGQVSAPRLTRRAVVTINPKDRIDLFDVSDLEDQSETEKSVKGGKSAKGG